MNTAMLVLRLVPGLLFIGHGLQKLTPPQLSPPLLHAQGPAATAAGFRQLGLRPALPLAFLTGATEIAGGFLVAAGLVTPLGTALLAAVMTVAIVTVHLRNGIWATEGGFEFALLMLTNVFVITALGPGTLSIDEWAGVSDWTGIHWTTDDLNRAGAAIGVGAAAGLLALTVGFAERMVVGDRHLSSSAS